MPKINVEEAKKRAATYFMTRPTNFPEGRPYNCCETVLSVLKDFYLSLNSELIPKIGTVVGAGLSLTGNQCGALTAAAIVIGAEYGRTKPEESPAKAWSMGQELVKSFKEEFNYTTCRDLTGVDLRTAEGLQKYYKEIHDSACTERVKFAVGKAVELIGKNRK
jgi:C_GCAxxG_C_C family probable redox protein